MFQSDPQKFLHVTTNVQLVPILLQIVKLVMKIEITMIFHFVHVSHLIMKKMVFVLNVHINVKNVPHPQFVQFVPEIVYH